MGSRIRDRFSDSRRIRGFTDTFATHSRKSLTRFTRIRDGFAHSPSQFAHTLYSQGLATDITQLRYGTVTPTPSTEHRARHSTP
eukprot:4226694-Prymnesium_polylepis.1